MEFINLEIKDHIGIVTFSRPPVNALTQQVYTEIIQVFNEINNNHSIRVAVLRAEGKIFMAGNDVNDFKTLKPTDYEKVDGVISESIKSIYNCRIPVITALHGTAVGAGCSLVSNCDIIIASEEAKLSIPEIKVGVIGGGHNISRLIPHKVVRYLGLTGEYITAQDLLSFGGVLKVVARKELMAEVLDIANTIAKQSPTAVELYKQYLNNIEVVNTVNGHDGPLNRILVNHEDSKEAVAAFFEKRQPEFKNSDC